VTSGINLADYLAIRPRLSKVDQTLFDTDVNAAIVAEIEGATKQSFLLK